MNSSGGQIYLSPPLSIRVFSLGLVRRPSAVCSCCSPLMCNITHRFNWEGEDEERHQPKNSRIDDNHNSFLKLLLVGAHQRRVALFLSFYASFKSSLRHCELQSVIFSVRTTKIP